MKPIVWTGDSRKRIREFPADTRARAGFELWEVQQGNDPSDWKPLPSVGHGVREIRVHADGEFRVIYVARFDDAVYVLHAFGKKNAAHRQVGHRTRPASIQGFDQRKEQAMTGKLRKERASGNVFSDIGFPSAEAHNLALRAELMSRIRHAARGLTQAEAARRFGVTQPRINDVLRGKIDKFSLDALVNMLGKAGLRVEVQVRKAA